VRDATDDSVLIGTNFTTNSSPPLRLGAPDLFMALKAANNAIIFEIYIKYEMKETKKRKEKRTERSERKREKETLIVKAVSILTTQ
jgi:hypothetical protein